MMSKTAAKDAADRQARKNAAAISGQGLGSSTVVPIPGPEPDPEPHIHVVREVPAEVVNPAPSDPAPVDAPREAPSAPGPATKRGKKAAAIDDVLAAAITRRDPYQDGCSRGIHLAVSQDIYEKYYRVRRLARKAGYGKISVSALVDRAIQEAAQDPDGWCEAARALTRTPGTASGRDLRPLISQDTYSLLEDTAEDAFLAMAPLARTALIGILDRLEDALTPTGP